MFIDLRGRRRGTEREGGGREGGRERDRQTDRQTETLIGCLPCASSPGTEPTTLVCVWTRNQTCNL